MANFITIPVCLSSKQEGAAEKTVNARFDPADISLYHPAYHWGSIIHTKHGMEFLTTMDANDIDELISNQNSGS